MDLHAWVAVATLVVAVVLFISRWIPLEATALGIPVALAVSGVLEPQECLRGFSSQAVIALAAIFVLGAGLERSGVATIVARGLERLGGTSRTRIVFVLMVAGAGLSAFMSNAATVAVFLPAVAVVCRRTGISASRLMMPLAFACILGGTLTLIGTTPNLILADELRLRHGEGLGMFEFAVVGGPVTLAGILFMSLVGWRMLPRREAHDRLDAAQQPRELAKSYDFVANLYSISIPEGSGLAGRSIADACLGREYQLDVVLVMRPSAVGRKAVHPTPDLVMEPGDHVYVEGAAIDAWRLVDEQTVGLQMASPDELETILGRGITLAEVTPAPRSEAIGRTFRELHFRRQHGVGVISIWRRDEVLTADIADVPLELGDAFLVSGPTSHIRELARDPDFVVLGERERRHEDVSHAPVALALLLLAILPPLFGWLPLAFSALAASLLMILTGCVRLESARRSIDWTILFLIIGTIPLGAALQQTGVAAHLARGILSLDSVFGEAGLLAALFALAAVLSTTSNNGAAAVILAPVAGEASEIAGIDITHTFLAVAMGASCAFVLPFAHQCNLMVMGPGGYGTRDFARVGAALSVVMTVVAVAVLAML